MRIDELLAMLCVLLGVLVAFLSLPRVRIRRKNKTPTRGPYR